MPHTILIVDDDHSMRDMLNMAFEDAGFETLNARDGKEALSLLAVYNAQIVVSDILMPVLDGCELYHRMQEHPRLKMIPFVAISSLPPSRIKSCKIAPAAYLRKPCNLTELLRITEQLLTRSDTPIDTDSA